MNFDIIDWNPINSYDKFNLLTRVHIKPTIELLQLFKNAKDHNLLCTISETETHNATVYGIIDKSVEDETYYITLDLVWMEYPKKNGKISFKSAPKTTFFINNLESPGNLQSSPGNLQSSPGNLQSSPGNLQSDSNCNDLKSRMKFSDLLIPIGISLVLIGLSKYMFPKEFFN
jgi:hypothetical protein